MAKQGADVTALPLSTTVHMILLALLKGAAHGYAIMQNSADISGGTIILGPASLYTNLNKCLEAQLIQEVTTGGESSDERRRPYRLTAKGRKVLAAETERLASLVAYARKRAK